MANKRKPHPPHWYQMTYEHCPACGRDDIYRLRVYGQKPPNYVCKVVETYDYCIEYGRT